MEQCCVGKFDSTQCYQKTFSSNDTKHVFDEFKAEEIVLLLQRLPGLNFDSDEHVCNYHKLRYLDYYSTFFKRCCDPFDKHVKRITVDLRVINSSLSDNFAKVDPAAVNLIPGQKLCKTCESLVKSKIEKPEEMEIGGEEATVQDQCIDSVGNSDSQPDSYPLNYSSGSSYNTQSQDVNSFNHLLSNFDIPPLKRQKLTDKKNVEKIILQVSSKVADKMQNLYNVEVPAIDKPVTRNVFEDSSALGDIINSLQERFQQTKKIQDKIELLLLLPKSWTYSIIRKYFDCTRYMYREVKRIQNTGDRHRKTYSKFSDEMKELIKNYYLDEKNSYICPGMRQCVISRDETSGDKIYTQKRLLLYTLHDLYKNFVHDYVGNEQLPKFSYFVSLKPKECVYAGDAGTHTICVCVEHENVKLKVAAITSEISYRDLLMGAVCDVDEADCMLQQCEKCLKEAGIKQVWNDCNIKLNSDVTVTYQRWDSDGSRASLNAHSENAREFLDGLFEDIWNLTAHHFIAESQKNYLVKCKNELTGDTAIVLQDFAENYSFIIQRSVQAFFYNNSQATIHPFVVYYKNTGAGGNKDTLQHLSFCVISDTKDHVAYTVHAFQEALIEAVTKELPWIKNCIYFSDGAPTQYKNKNNLANICWHENDFKIKIVSYNFFATSHGKSPCDAIGGSLKRTVMRHCLRSSPENQISTPREMYEYASKHIENIRALWVPDNVVQNHKRKLTQRFTNAKTIKETRRNHCYVPIDENTLEKKVTSYL